MTTMEASTIEPKATTIPEMERMFTVSPMSFIPIKVKKIERGMETPITIVALMSLRNKKMTRIAINIPMTPDCITVLRELVTVVLSSAIILNLIAPPVSFSHSLRTVLIWFVILIAFPSLRLNTSTTIISSPSLLT